MCGADKQSISYCEIASSALSADTAGHRAEQARESIERERDILALSHGKGYGAPRRDMRQF